MTTKKAAIYSAGITVVSVVLLTLTEGVPTSDQLLRNGASMFAGSFVVLKLIVGAFKRSDGRDVF